MRKFVLVDEIIPNVILDMRYYSNYNFVGTMIDGYLEECAIVTVECGEALKKVNEEISKYGYVIKIFDAYRPQMAVDHFVRWSQNSDEKMKEYFYKNLSKKDIFEKQYIMSKSSHTRGSTVDLTFYDLKNNCDLDTGGNFDLFDDSSRYDNFDITSTQRENRKFLRYTMVRCGFIPIQNEWWHFTLKNEPYPNTYFSFPVSRNIF